MKNFIKTYGKSIVMVLATIASSIVAALAGNEVITATEWVNIAIVGVGAAAVLAAPDVPGAKYTKLILAGLMAGLTVLASAILGGISITEWLQIGVAVAGALGVSVAPYKPTLKA